MLRLLCKAQNYEWGKLGTQSKVGELLASGDSSLEINDRTPFAELWMGTHPNVPSLLAGSFQLLQDAISENPADFLSSSVVSRYGATLPFLFKVLSIRKALSIQAHPDKQLAERLHTGRPDVYKDNNHKPEMACALTEFEALVGFRPLNEIRDFLNRYDELREVVGESCSSVFIKSIGEKDISEVQQKGILRDLFGSLMSSEPDKISSSLQKLLNNNADSGDSIIKLIRRLNIQFPNDVGCFCAFLLNYVVLSPGDAIYLGANEPHAYLSGDCVECMATSDNVVRAGLTPKYKDVGTLIKMLTYRSASASAQIMRGEPVAGSVNTKIYDPPIDEFTIWRTEMPVGSFESLSGVSGPGILICIEGSVDISFGSVTVTVYMGHIFFIKPNTLLVLRAQKSKALIFMAFCSV